MLRNSNIKKLWVQFFLLINVIISSHHLFFVCFQLLKFIMDGNLILALGDVLVIEHIFFKYSKQCVLKGIMQKRSLF
jgi:hypothetical protein